MTDYTKLIEEACSTAGKYELERYYGTSKEYTAMCKVEASEAQRALQSAIESMEAEIERLKIERRNHYKMIEDVLTFARDVNEPSPEMIEQALAALRKLQVRQPLTDEQCEAIYTSLNEWARDVDRYDFGLPMNDTDKPIGLEVIKKSANARRPND